MNKYIFRQDWDKIWICGPCCSITFYYKSEYIFNYLKFDHN